MNYLSVCSGIEAATVGWHHLGWNAVAYSEIEAFPSQVLAHHYPHVPNLGDMTKYKEWKIDSVGLLVGGTPCQSFSVAGLRKGLDDPRGNLALTYVGILDRFKPRWFIWENVPGVLSSNGGKDFGSFLGAVVECGYGFAYRVLDAQYFRGTPQRRRRVFVVGYLGDWRPASQVLFVPDCLSGNTKKSAKKKESATAFTTSSFGGYSEGIGTVRASGGDLGGGSETIVTVYSTHPADSRVTEMGDVCQTVTSRWGTGGGNVPIVIPINDKATRYKGGGITRNSDGSGNGLGIGNVGDPSPTLTRGDKHAIFNGLNVRKLTPIECERLQGFPDNYTNIPWRGKMDSPDGARYKAIGNSMAVPVMRWIGERIHEYEKT